MKKLLPVIILILLLAACKKQEADPPVVIILSPAESDSFFITDSVTLNFTISDKNLMSYKIIVSNFSNRKIYYKEEAVAENNSITIDKKIFFNINADTTALINVLGIDKNGNTSGTGVKFKIKQ